MIRTITSDPLSLSVLNKTLEGSLSTGTRYNTASKYSTGKLPVSSVVGIVQRSIPGPSTLLIRLHSLLSSMILSLFRFGRPSTPRTVPTAPILFGARSTVVKAYLLTFRSSSATHASQIGKPLARTLGPQITGTNAQPQDRIIMSEFFVTVHERKRPPLVQECFTSTQFELSRLRNSCAVKAAPCAI